jgi:hypothetical protein
MASWLDKYNDDVPNAQNGIEGTMGGLTDKGFNYNGAWGGTMAMGGSLPGSVGFTYARTISPAPSNGKYAKKTKASAQRGKNIKPIDNTNITNEVINYTKEYMNSPMYKQMLSASAKNEDDANTIQLNRNLNLDSTIVNFPEKQRQYNLYGDSKSSGLVNIYPLAQRDNITGNVLAHEISHSVDRPISSRNRIIPQSDIDLISAYSNSKGRLFDRFSKYTALPTETRAQLNNIRYDAKSSNLYDPFTEKVTPEILEKIKNSKTKNGYSDLKDVYSDEQIINLLNTISKNNQPSQEFPIAQNGQEMKYYQEGLDWKPKSISKDGGWLNKYEGGGVIEDDMGQWAHPGKITKINSNQITMQGVDYPVLGISDTGDTQMMQPGQDYTYDGKSVTEYPMMQEGGPVEKTYGTYRLPEVVITGQAPEKGFWDQSISSFLNENKDAGLLGALSSVVTYPLGLPQQAMMYGLTGKVQRPSEALNIKNPIGALATDVIADPTNLLGIGLADDALKLSGKANRFISKQPFIQDITAPIKFRNETKILKSKFNDIVNRYQTDPEAARRLTETLGITPEQLGSPKLTFKSGVGSKYSPKNNSLNIDFREARDLQKLGYDLSDEAILEHEWNHYLQKKAYEVSPEYKTLVDEYYDNLDFYNSEKSKVGPLKFKMDNFFSNNPLKKPDYPNAVSMPTSVDYDLLNAFGNPELIRENLTRRGANDLEYFIEGVPGRKGLRTMIEPMPHLAEMRQNMLERGIIQNRYQPITEENVYQFLSNPNGDRISRFASHKNPETIKALTDALKILPAAIPAGIVASTQLPEEKNGGWLNKYK